MFARVARCALLLEKAGCGRGADLTTQMGIGGMTLGVMRIFSYGQRWLGFLGSRHDRD